MSELPRIMPIPGASVPPVRPSRRTGREPRRKSGDDSKPTRPSSDATEEIDEDVSDPTGTEDEPAKGGSINLRV